MGKRGAICTITSRKSVQDHGYSQNTRTLSTKLYSLHSPGLLVLDHNADLTVTPGDSPGTAHPPWARSPSSEEYSRIMEKARWMGDIWITDLHWRRMNSRQGWTSQLNMSLTCSRKGDLSCYTKRNAPGRRGAGKTAGDCACICAPSFPLRGAGHRLQAPTGWAEAQLQDNEIALEPRQDIGLCFHKLF